MRAQGDVVSWEDCPQKLGLAESAVCVLVEGVHEYLAVGDGVAEAVLEEEGFDVGRRNEALVQAVQALEGGLGLEGGLLAEQLAEDLHLLFVAADLQEQVAEAGLGLGAEHLAGVG